MTVTPTAPATAPHASPRPVGEMIATVIDGRPRRIAGLRLAPGLYLTRGPRYCPDRLSIDESDWYSVCEDLFDWPASCPHRPRWAWHITSAAGLLVYEAGFTQPVAAVRAAAADLAALPFTWTDPDPARQLAALTGEVRAAARDIVVRLINGGYTPDGETVRTGEAA